MDFVDLDRSFAPLRPDEEATLDWDAEGGRRFGGWLGWTELLGYRRVVLLAEALSGKTEELKYRARTLSQQGKPAFFVRIEDLADEGLLAALDENALASFDAWKAHPNTEAWFFLDSVDEARLNNKSFEKALRAFAKAIGIRDLGRSHVIVSCRVSDWRGNRDRRLVSEQLPYAATSTSDGRPTDPEDALLRPIFDRREPTRNDVRSKPEPKRAELLVVQLVPLTAAQKAKLAGAAGVENVAQFTDAVERSGIEAMAERPGDLIDLVGYWRTYRRFAPLREMTELGVANKLKEENPFRPDSSSLSAELVRNGVDRVAAALTLGKSFTLKALGQEPDPTLAAGAIDPTSVLTDWNDAEVASLIRRGVFSPATYGRIRFHHRATQEYLTAAWLLRLLNENCPLAEVWDLLFRESYGVATVTPSLRAIAAWIALDNPVIREEIIRREPAILIQFGDAKSLPLKARENLLLAYASMHARGDVNTEILDHRAVWMFASKDLDGAIRRAWKANSRTEFRVELLRFVREAKIDTCVDLARASILDRNLDTYARLVALEVLVECSDLKGLEEVAVEVKAAPDRLSARLAPAIARALYPNHLTTGDLLDLLDRSQPGRQFHSEGFGRLLPEIFELAPTHDAKKQLVLGVAELCLAPPFDPDGAQISKRHQELAQGLPRLSERVLFSTSTGVVDPGLIRLLFATERAVENHTTDERLAQIQTRVRSDKVLNRALFWADVEADHGKAAERVPRRWWQVGPIIGQRLWEVDLSDVEWLAEDCRARPDGHDRQVAFSAVFSILQNANQVVTRRELLEQLAATDPVLAADLAEYREPYRESDSLRESKARQRRARAQREQQQEKDKRSWREFQANLIAEPSVLSRPESLATWKAGLWRLHELTRWLRLRTKNDSPQAARDWRLLEEGFDASVAERFFEGMKQAARRIKPERPEYQGNSTYTTKYSSVLAIAAIFAESSDVTSWGSSLTEGEIATVAMHACFQGYNDTDWFRWLAVNRTSIVEPILLDAVSTEYRSKGAYSDVLSYYAYHEAPPASVANKLVQLLRAKEPANDITLERSLIVLSRATESLSGERRVRSLLRRRMLEHLARNDVKKALQYFSLFARLAPDESVELLDEILPKNETETEAQHADRTHRWLTTLFSRDTRGQLSGVLKQLSIDSLKRLIRTMYSYLPPREVGAVGDELEYARDAADEARHLVLNALIDRPGLETHRALLEFASDPQFAANAIRLKELAHRRLEIDSELPPWSAAEVVAFEKNFVGVVKTGADLLRLTIGVLSDISAGFANEDASSRSLLALAESEEQVQKWLAEQLAQRSKQRYHVHREAEVADLNEPDIVVSSAAARVEVALEVKHANRGWTIPQLERALRVQLARDYLRSSFRRHGVLVVTQHKVRTWRFRDKTWYFDDVIAYLKEVASGLTRNDTGPIEVQAVGLNAVEPVREHKKRRRP